MNTDPKAQGDPSPPPRWQVWLSGIFAGDIAIVSLFVADAFLIGQINAFGYLGIPSMFLVPTIGGLVASYLWRPLKPGLGATRGIERHRPTS